jgi:hypothetical protein
MKRLLTLLAVLFIIPWSVYATVSDTTQPLRIYTSGVTTEYPIPFEYIDDADITVALYDPDTDTEVAQTLDVDYTIVDETVTYAAAPGAEFYVIIRRNTPYTQEASFQAGQAPPLSRYESAFDKLTYQTQDLNERLERAFILPESTVLRNPVFPDPAFNAAKGIRFKSDGTGIEGYEVFENGLTINIAKVSDYASFSAMMAAIGSTEKTIIVDTAVTMTTNFVIPSTMRLDFYRTGCITLGAYNLTFASSDSIYANRNKIFNRNGSGNVSFVDYTTVYPQWWGALGDGSNNDTVYIQYAIDSLTKGVVEFGSKSYLSDALVGDSNISLHGSGATITLRTAATDLFTATSESNIDIEGIHFVGTNVNTATERLVYFNTCTNVRVQDCSFSASIVGLQAHTCTSVFVSHNKFFDIIRLSTGAEGYGFLADTDNSGITFSDNIGTHIARHFCYVSAGSSDVTITGNVATGCHGTPFVLSTSGYAPYSQNIGRNCVIKGNTVNGVSYDASGTDEFAGIDVTGYYSGVVIEGNSIYNVTNSSSKTAYGIYVQSSSSEAIPINGVIIKGNHIGTVDDIGIVVRNGKNIQAVDNTIKNITGQGINASVSGTTSGGSYLDHVIIDRNIIDTVTTYGILVSGTSASFKAGVSIGNNWITGAGTYDINPGSYSDIKWTGEGTNFEFYYDDVAQNLSSFTTAMHRGGTADFFIMPWDGYVTSLWAAYEGTMTTGGITLRMADSTGHYSATEIELVSSTSQYTTSGNFVPFSIPAGRRVYIKINSDSDFNPTTIDIIGGVHMVRDISK